MLRLDHIKKSFGKKTVLTDVNYEFEENRIYPVLGGTDAWVSTLFGCICQDLPVDEGIITIDNNNKKANTYYVAKQSVLPMYISGYEFIKFLCEIRKKPDKPANYLKRVGIDEDFWNVCICDYCFELKKRLQLAAFLVQQPYVVMFEEPLDYCSEEYIATFLEVLNEYKMGHIVLISTGLLEIATRIADDIVVLNDGELHDITGEMLEMPEISKALQGLLGELEE